jgi:hypothetical protein
MQLGKLALRLPLADVLRDQQQQNGLVVEAVMLEDILALLITDPGTQLRVVDRSDRGRNLDARQSNVLKTNTAWTRTCLDLNPQNPYEPTKRRTSYKSGGAP